MSKKPEKQVVLEILQWGFFNKMWLHNIESRATYSEKLKRYNMSGNAPKGYPDISGIGAYGEPVFIEVKANGKLSTLKLHQRLFLVSAIERDAFAVCVDSVALLDAIYKHYSRLPTESKKEFLFKNLNSIKQ